MHSPVLNSSHDHNFISIDNSNIKCFKCHMYDHFHSECCTNLNREHGKKSNDAEKDKEVP